MVPVEKLATGPIQDSLDAVLIGFVNLRLLTTGSFFLATIFCILQLYPAKSETEDPDAQALWMT